MQLVPYLLALSTDPAAVYSEKTNALIQDAPTIFTIWEDTFTWGGLGLQLLCWKHGGSCTDQQKAGRHPMPMPQRRDTGLAARPPPESRTNAPNQDAVVYRYTGGQVRQQVGHLDYPC